ncbi:hypothetical protein BGZ46_007107 [Entomortierella lignicola]|nr:hypothetical protein BGZ46_007107 [Entomortierella lignicola]
MPQDAMPSHSHGKSSVTTVLLSEGNLIKHTKYYEKLEKRDFVKEYIESFVKPDHDPEPAVTSPNLDAQEQVPIKRKAPQNQGQIRKRKHKRKSQVSHVKSNNENVARSTTRKKEGSSSRSIENSQMGRKSNDRQSQSFVKELEVENFGISINESSIEPQSSKDRCNDGLTKVKKGNRGKKAVEEKPIIAKNYPNQGDRHESVQQARQKRTERLETDEGKDPHEHRDKPYTLPILGRTNIERV